MEQNMLKGQYDYYAFVSYASKDEKWAEWLQTALEHYRLPTGMQKDDSRLPKRIFPVFRDKTDLGGGILKKSLHRELEASQYLIVICSPHAVASDWVCEEISYFISLGRAEKIIPVVVDGAPFSQDPTKECFPLPLRQMEEEHLGISVARHSRMKAFLLVVAALLNVRPDQVIRRDKRRRQIRGLVAGFLSLALAAGAAGILWWNLPHSKYYRDHTTRWEIPEGIYELTDRERSGLGYSYKITTQRGKVIRMECVNSADAPQQSVGKVDISEYPINIYEYDDDGRLVSVEVRTETDQMLYKKVLNYSAVENVIAVDYQAPSGSLQAFALAADTGSDMFDTDQSDRSEITRQKNTYNDEGLLIQILYQRDNLGTPACDINGVYGIALEYNEMGQIICSSKLDAQGNVTEDRCGCAMTKFSYDAQGNMIGGDRYDAQGNPAADEDNVYSSRYRYDMQGNVVEQSFFDAQGNPTNCTEGYSIVRIEYDENGFDTRMQFLDAEENPCYEKETGACEVRYTNDDLGRVVEMTFYDRQGRPVYNPIQGCVTYRQELDEKGRCLFAQHLDAEGGVLPIQDTRAVGVRYEYDEYGNQVLVEYLNAKGKPAMTAYGYASQYHEYDDAGHCIRTEYRDPEGNLCITNEQIAVVERQFDPFGNWVGTRYYDEKGGPALYFGCVAITEYTYEGGNMTGAAYYDGQGNPVLYDGYHRARYTYDEKGNRISSEFFGVDGEYYTGENNYALIHRQFDAYGNVVELCWYDENLVLVERELREYDSRNNVIRADRYLIEGENQSLDIMLREFDEYDNLVKITYLDENGNLVDGEAYVVAEYDGMGNVVRRVSLDKNGQPLPIEEGAYNAVEYEYDEAGNQLSEKWIMIQTDGTEDWVIELQYVYNGRNDQVERNLVMNAGGKVVTICVTLTYNLYGDLLEESNFWSTGEPMTDDYGVHRKVYTYDEMGNLLTESDYDIDGNLVDYQEYGN